LISISEAYSHPWDCNRIARNAASLRDRPETL
jgi:hypothetical protein